MKKAILVVFGVLMALSSLPACSKKEGGKTTRVDRYRNGDYRSNPYRDPYSNPNTPAGEWGVIYNNSSSMNNVLQAFMPDVEDLGFVSGSPSASTGIRFRGQVNNNSGRIDLMVWDDKAQELEPYFWSLQIVSSQEDQRGATIVAEDNVGRVTFNGTFSGSEFRGQVTFINDKTDGARGTLGTFAIDTCALFACGY